MTFTNDYIRRRGPSHDPRQLNHNEFGSRNHTRTNLNDVNQLTDETATYLSSRNNWNYSARKNSCNSGRGQSFDRQQNHSANRNDDNYHRTSSSRNLRGTWQNFANYPRSPSGPRRDPQQNRQY